MFFYLVFKLIFTGTELVTSSTNLSSISISTRSTIYSELPGLLNALRTDYLQELLDVRRMPGVNARHPIHKI